jgi:hypothetical protein
LNFSLSRDLKSFALVEGSYVSSTKSLWLGTLDESPGAPQHDTPCKRAGEHGLALFEIFGSPQKYDTILFGHSTSTDKVAALYSLGKDTLVTKVRRITHIVDCAKQVVRSDAL